jgi:hypothetical protein
MIKHSMKGLTPTKIWFGHLFCSGGIFSTSGPEGTLYSSHPSAEFLYPDNWRVSDD